MNSRLEKWECNIILDGEYNRSIEETMRIWERCDKERKGERQLIDSIYYFLHLY